MNQSRSLYKQPFHPSLEHLLIAAIAIGIMLRLINLGTREFWYDEILSLMLSTGQKLAYQSPEETPVILSKYSSLLKLPAEITIPEALKTLISLLRGLVGGEPHPPLFFLSQHFWLRLVGNSEIAMRSLNALLSIAAIGCTYGLGKTILGHRGGLLLAALLATNPFYLFHSLNVRMYAPLVLWISLSTWALLQRIKIQINQKSQNSGMPATKFPIFFWDILLIASVTAGILTFYLYIYWIITLAIIAIYLDRCRWWQHALNLAAGILLSVPWILWGTRQQLRNADFQRFNAPAGLIARIIQHFQDVAQTLGTHLLLGDWVTSLPPASRVIVGVGVMGVLAGVIVSLWRQARGERGRIPIVQLSLLLSLLPLLLALAVDIVTGKFTVGFGWGRSMIWVLPGCLLLLAVWVEKAASRWRKPAVAVLLLLYLSVSIGDYSLRQRWVFHKIADVIAQQPTTPTLIAMNSQAWGHVMRLAYYISPTMPVNLLAQESNQLPNTLEKVLKSEGSRYSRIVWLESAMPVWSKPATEAERQQVKQVLNSRFQLIQQQSLSGTMDLDEFRLSLYTRSADH
ncbi:glycosyltransferase family 39 protein [Microcoleus sp. FACHB-672]|uniref:glycosyltransferase family 39 protein n=1 Tax=Microcoleus sp. FACHB-672 TaxID=2692825 RepID=UPI0016854384|nr:glycosyltransferase family 39 protein [Microcoleus sp. FACHB-672]MBD2040800.1 glycosyltransferase family 39 protein [Microcoleus sp. FACHB-672]